MADNLQISQGTGTTIATDEVSSGAMYQKIKLADGTADSTTMILAGGGVEAGALRVTIASDSTGVLSIDDNGGAITVDGTVAVTNAGITSIDGKITACNTGAVVLAAGTAEIGKLAAGTAGIGKLTANSGVDIGDVDVTSIAAGDNNIGNVDIVTMPAVTISNASINGAGAPVIDSYTHAAINLAAGANQVLVSSAANKQVWVYGITFTVNVAGTVSFQDEDDTAITGIMPIDAKGGMAISPSGNFAMPIWKLATDKDLEVDVVTSEIDGFLTYALVSV
jgi:hypothetical protein